MDESQKYNRISRIHLENIALKNHFKPVSQRNNVFNRLKRNTTVLCNRANQSNQKDIISLSCQSKRSLYSLNKDDENINQQKQQIEKSLSQNKLKKQKQNLPKIFLFKNSIKQIKNKQKNEIQGTNLEILSTRQILKKYQFKILREELKKKQFLENHIKNLKSDENETEYDENNNYKINLSRISNNFITSLNRKQIQSKVSSGFNQSQYKLNELLQNRLTDKDYIDFNIKLFQKKDINKKRFFQRYHNILKRQRDQANKSLVQ